MLILILNAHASIHPYFQHLHSITSVNIIKITILERQFWKSLKLNIMKRQNVCIVFLLFFFLGLTKMFGQVSINNTLNPPHPSSMLDIESSSKGVLIPRMTELEKNNISNPSHSLLLYQTDGETGFYYNSGTPLSPIWIPLSSTPPDEFIRIPIDTLPFTISTSGSYFLTETLSASAGMNGITITASNVAIDMNGNGLIGDGAGTNVAILSSGTISHIKVFNGFISSWGGHGINLSSSTSVTLNHVQVDGSGQSGFNLGQESLVFNCTATNNGADGFNANNSSTISNCNALNNGSDGIDVSNYCTIVNCHAKTNQGNGLETGSTCQVSHCISYDNDDNGVYLGSGSTIIGCISSSNTLSGFELLTSCKADNNQARSNSANGFLFSNDAFISNCSADNNTLSGFLCDGSDARIDNNQSTDNSQHGFSITGTGNIIIRNTSSGNLSLSYNIVAGNMAGTVLTTDAILNSNSNPYANIAF